MIRRRTFTGAALLTAAALSLAACGGDSEADDDATGGAADTEVVAEAEEIAAEAQEELEEPVPEESAPIAEDVFVVVVPCEYASEACARGTDSAIEAAESLGWEAQMIDAEGNPDVWRSAVEQAIATDADAIIFQAAPPDILDAQLAEAREAGIALVTSMEPADDRFDFNVWPDEDRTGEIAAAAVTADSGGDAQILVINDPTYPSLTMRAEGFVSGIEELCPGCEIVDQIDTQFTQLQTNLPTQVQGILTSNPDIDYIYTYTGAAVAALQPTIATSPNADEIQIGSFDGNGANLEFVENGSQMWDVIKPMEYTGYLSVWAVNQLLNDEEVEDQEMPLRLVQQDSLPELPWTGDSDWRTGFEELWANAG